MAEHPILFSAPMVKALLAGQKTQTRRLIHWAPLPGEEQTNLSFSGVSADDYCTGNPEQGKVLYVRRRSCWHQITEPQHCRYGQPGDRLWVRESLKLGALHWWRYAADLKPVRLPKNSPHESAMVAWAHHKEGTSCPSIHMPRWASRILLEVTEVRVERLQAASDLDLLAEGIDYDYVGDDQRQQRRAKFAQLWDQLNGERASWASNPWVWAVTFKRMEASR